MYETSVSARDVIGKFGGIRPMADKLGHTFHTTVQGWHDRNLIPVRRWPEVLDLAKAERIRVTRDDLMPSEHAP